MSPTSAREERRLELLRYYAREVAPFDGDPGFMGAYHELPTLELEHRGEEHPPLSPSNVRATVEYLYSRQDCGDFGLAALLRMLYRYPESDVLTDELRGAIETAASEFIFWLDEPGEESMCFWTENHQALFHSAQLLAGQRLPDAEFSNGETGGWHRQTGRERMERWLDWRVRFGFSEWHSNSYYEEDVLALANVAEFADDEKLREKARSVLDLLLFHVAVNSHRGVFGSPHGRTYASAVLDPASEGVTPAQFLYWGQGTRSNDISRAGPLLAASDYESPAAIDAAAADDPEELESRERHSLDVAEAPDYGVDPDDPDHVGFFLGAQVYNHRDVVETTVDTVPEKHYLYEPAAEALEYFRRQEERAGSWRRLTYDPDPNCQAMTRADVYTFRTPEFMLSCAQDYRKGRAGFQQHVWQATLGDGVPVYTTHPGTEDLDGRPNYWHGNGVLPRALAHRNVAVCLYRVGPSPADPAYTHAFFPRHALDEWTEAEGWYVGRTGDAYVALRSARPTEFRPPDADTVALLRPDNAESEWEPDPYDLVADGRENAWVCELGNERLHGGFDAFVSAVTAADISLSGTAVEYDSPSVGRVEAAWEGPLRVDGKRVETSRYPRFDSPYCRAEFGATRFEIECDDERLVVDPDVDQGS